MPTKVPVQVKDFTIKTIHVYMSVIIKWNFVFFRLHFTCFSPISLLSLTQHILKQRAHTVKLYTLLTALSKETSGVSQWVALLTRNVAVVGSNPCCFLEQETLPLLLSTGWFQESQSN